MPKIKVIIRLITYISNLLLKILDFFQKHKVLTIILFLTFIMKYYLADWNSYWLDELYSVYERGIMFDNVSEVLEYHREHSTGMPLYEYKLYLWMLLFGHDEVATRSLSTLYVTLSTLFLYLFALKVYSKRIAIATSMLYSFSYMAVYYSLEARYYGQMLFLCTFSSYVLVLYLESLTDGSSWKKILWNKYFLLLAIVNIALMLTFPFNYLFLVAQAVFVLIYFIYQNKLAKALDSLIKVFVVYLLQIIFMGLIWDLAVFRGVWDLFSGSISRMLAIADASTNHGDASVTENSGSIFVSYESPVAIFNDNVISPNLDLSLLLYASIIILFILFMVNCIAMLYKGGINASFMPRRIYNIYTFLWLIFPAILVYLLFSVGQLDKLRPRYLIFCTPPLFLALTLSLEQGIRLINVITKTFIKRSIARHYLRYSLIYAILMTILFTLPGGYIAATHQKDDWRGIAKQVVHEVESNSSKEYIVLHASTRRLIHKQTPSSLNYYFEIFSEKVRAYDVIRRMDSYRLETDKSFMPEFLRADSIRHIEDHDYLIIVFPHFRGANSFTEIIALLDNQYNLEKKQLNSAGRGYLIYNTKFIDEEVEYKEERISNGLKFNWANNDVNLGFSPEFDVDDSFTFELWLKIQDLINASSVLFGPVANQSGAYGIHSNYQGRLSYGLRTDDNMARVDFTRYRLNVWYHLAGVYDSSERIVKLYIDGELIGTEELSGEDVDLSNESFVLHGPATIHGPRAEIGLTNCVMYDARLWDTARTQEEIMANMFKRLDGTEENLIGYWPLDEGSGDIAHDLTANENHGAIHGATWYTDE